MLINCVKKKILIIPDAYFGDFSGVYVAQIAKRLLIELGCSIAILSDEVRSDRVDEDGTKIFYRLPCSALANWKEKSHKENYLRVLDDFKPDAIYTLGSVTNKNILFWSIARKRGIKVISKIFMQDFFCYNYYANDKKGLCTKCLDNGFKEALFRKCARSTDNGISGFLRKLNSTINRYRLQKELTKADAVITSSQQQIEFYVRYGVPRENCYTTPLYFNGDKLNKYKISLGAYFVFVAQNRVDKGIHLLKDILKHCNSNVKVVAAYASQKSIDFAIQKYGLQPYIDKGILEMRNECTWKTNLGEVIAASRGVVNPSIWPSTTEFVLLEALGLKKPIFTFKVGIHPEIMKSGVNAFVADTPKTMAAQINELSVNDSLYNDVSDGAYNLYQKMTDWEGWKNTLREILEKK
jgi:glycosyltransferase involved in cell wall biosynthesis